MQMYRFFLILRKLWSKIVQNIYYNFLFMHGNITQTNIK